MMPREIRLDIMQQVPKFRGDSVDMVNHPPHYCKGGIECKDAIREATKGYRGWSAKCAGDVIKYIWRAPDKNGLEDLKKALWYMKELVAEIEKTGL